MPHTASARNGLGVGDSWRTVLSGSIFPPFRCRTPLGCHVYH
jgi:hypothetical protein